MKYYRLGLIYSYMIATRKAEGDFEMTFHWEIATFSMKKEQYEDDIFLKRLILDILNWVMDETFKLTNGIEDVYIPEKWQYGIMILDTKYNFIDKPDPIFNIIDEYNNRTWTKEYGSIDIIRLRELGKQVKDSW